MGFGYGVFVKTSDADTKDQLLKEGFILHCEEKDHYGNPVFTFINRPDYRFTNSGIDVKKLVYTNIITL